MTVIEEIAAERQQDVEGWTERHDDEHGNCALARAAAAYAAHATVQAYPDKTSWPDVVCNIVSELWPFDQERWKPKDARRDLIRAGALIVAEIERLDRLNQAHA